MVQVAKRPKQSRVRAAFLSKAVGMIPPETQRPERSGPAARPIRPAILFCFQEPCDKGGQGCVKLQARPRIDLPCPGGVQPHPPALLIAKPMQQPVMPQIVGLFQRNARGKPGRAQRRYGVPCQAMAGKTRPLPRAILDIKVTGVPVR